MDVFPRVLKWAAGPGLSNESGVTGMQRNSSLAQLAPWAFLLLFPLRRWLVAAESNCEVSWCLCLL